MAIRMARAAGLAAALLAAATAAAQPATPAARPAAAPSSVTPIRYVVPFAPGSGNDLLARRMGQLLAESLRQPVVIENQAGAGGIIGIAQVVRAAPNGLTIGMGSTSTLAIGPYLQKEAPYDPVRDLAPVTLLASSPYVIAVHPKVPVNTLAELVSHARASRGRLNYSSAGIGTTPHLAGEVFKSIAGIEMTHVPYKGAAPATAAAVAGDVEILFGPIISTAPMMNSRQLKALAMTALQRSPVIPAVPTVIESGYPGYEATNWYGIVAPARTAPDTIERLNREIVRHLGAPELRTQIANDGAQVLGNSPAEFAAFIRSESERYRKIIRELNITAD